MSTVIDSDMLNSFKQVHNCLYEHRQLYNWLDKLCKWLQPGSAWAGKPGRLWRHCVDACSKQWGTFDWNLKKKNSYLFFTLASMWSWGITKVRSITKLLCLFLTCIWIFKTFHPAGCTTGCASVVTLQPVVQRVVKCIWYVTVKMFH